MTWIDISPKRMYRWPTNMWKSSGKCKLKPQWHITRHLSEWLSSINQQTSVSKDMEKKVHLCILGGLQIGATTMENIMEDLQKTKNRTTLSSSNSTSRNLSKEIKNTELIRCMHPHLHWSIIYNNQGMEVTWVPINRWWDKEEVVCIYNGILLGHKK